MMTLVLKNRSVFITRNRIIYLVSALQILFSSSNIFGQVFINEFQASNDRYVPEMYDFSDFPDWIELYNSGSSSVNLSGYSLTDDLDEPQKWIIPNGVTLAANGYFQIWADGFDAVPGMIFYRPWEWAGSFTTKFYHMPFKLSKGGEEIALFDPDGNMVDHIIFGPQLPDVSYGRKPDGSNDWFYFGDPTPKASNSTIAYSNNLFSVPPEISPDGGFYNNNISVSTSSVASPAVLKYTTDGSLPDETSPAYTSEITVNSSTSFRVRSYEPGILPSFPETQSYIFDEKLFSIPIISITTDPMFLWDNVVGIYTNELKQRDIPIRFEYFTNKDNKVVSTYASLRLSGQLSYTYPQKPFTITARSKFGADYLNYSFFNQVDNNDFKSIYLRNSGWPDIYYTFFRDALCHTIVVNQMDIDCQAYQPAATYLNGEFWGIYNIREKLSTNYFAYHHNVDPDNIDLLEYDSYSAGSEVIVCEGDAENYNLLLDYLESHDLSDEESYAYVLTQIDVDEYMNYMITEIYLDNNNWVHCNLKWWRERTDESKWRWILLDCDYAFGIGAEPSHNLLTELISSSPDWSRLVFNKLLESSSFRNEFIQRFAAYLNTVFKEERTVGMVDSLHDNIVGAMPYHIERWGGIYDPNRNLGKPVANMSVWEEYVEVMRNFALNRPLYQRQHIKQEFGISNIVNLNIDITGGNGNIFVNGVKLSASDLSGSYFTGIPIRLEAVPKAGYQFVEWIGISTEDSISLTIYNETELSAVFAPTDECIVPSDITEDYNLTDSCEYYIALGDIVVQPGATLYIDPGVEIRMPQSSNIYVYGSLIISGNRNEPAVIQPNSNIQATSWGAICFDNGTAPSELHGLILLDASKGDNDKYFGAISGIHTDITLQDVIIEDVTKPFYSEYGNIVINNCSFRSKLTCDLINVKYASSVLIENCDLRGNDAVDTDAIDLDGVSNAVVRANTIYGFHGFNSDGIDLGETCNEVVIENNVISNISDKAISVGQASTCIIRRNIIVGCIQGVGIKDFDSYAFIDQNTFYGNSYAVACFEKNIGYGGGYADVVNCIISSSILSPYYVDALSELNINYSLSDTEILPGIGNINADPLFVNELILNLELQENSPCINAGDPESPLDPDNTIADMGAYFIYTGGSEDHNIVINEINYHSLEGLYDSDDWIELYNYGNNEVDMSDWIFMDDNFGHKFCFQKGFKIQTGEFIVVNRNNEKFAKIFGGEIKCVGDFDFGLGNNGDVVRLFDPKMNIIDFVKYDDSAPWPEFPDGKGASLLLLDPLFDNTLPENWAHGYSLPSPGQDNRILVGDFNSSDKYGCSGLVEFRNLTMGIVDSYSWDFGDGTTSDVNNPSHIYMNTGPYTVQLEIHFNSQTELISKQVDVPFILPVPEVLNNYSCGPGSILLFANGSQYSFWYENQDNTEIIWEGDLFNTPELLLTTTYYVSNALGEYCTSRRVPVEATVYDPVSTDFEYTVNQNTVTFDNHSMFAQNCLWDFGDGTTSNDNSSTITHVYNEIGTYNVSLYAENESGDCSDLKDTIINITEVYAKYVFENNQIRVYPNPFTDFLNIEFSLPGQNKVKLDIFDITGDKLIIENLQNTGKNKVNTIDLSDIPEGVYLLKISMENSIELHKIVKY